MKHILLPIFLSLSIVAANAQTATQNCSTKYEVGKAMVWSGAGIAFTSAALYAAGTYQYHKNLNPETPEMNLAPVFSLIGAGTGAALALIGTPIMLSGKASLSSSASGMQLECCGMNGFGFTLEAGAAIPPALTLRGTAGYHLSENVFLGAGIARSFSMVANDKYAYTPAFANATFCFSKKRVAPYLGVDLGYDLTQHGVYGGTSAGIRISSRTNANAFTLSSTCEMSEDYVQAGLKVGYMF